MAEFEVITTRGTTVPKPGDKIVIDGIRGTVTGFDVFNGVKYQVDIPGLREDNSDSVSVEDWLLWSTILVFRQTS